MSDSLDIVTEDRPPWQPMSREQFVELVRGQRLANRRGRVYGLPRPNRFSRTALEHVLIRSGDLVRQVPERCADQYMLLPGPATG